MKSNEKDYYMKVTSDEDVKKKKKPNYNNLQKTYQKNAQKTFLKKKGNEKNDTSKKKQKKILRLSMMIFHPKKNQRNPSLKIVTIPNQIKKKKRK